MPTCSQAQCKIAESGVCLEGHKTDCPYIVKGDENSTGIIAPSEVDPTSTNKSEIVSFHRGEKLTISEASRLMHETPVKVVFCVGAQWSGKTTFMARVGELFRHGTMPEFRFAGSKTLFAFERASWLATIASGSSKADTTRSYLAERDTFYHLRVQKQDNKAIYYDLLISDLPGEAFPTVVASKDYCAEQRALIRADILVLFVDCKGLVDAAKRHSEKDSAINFLRRFAEVRKDVANVRVQIAFSRWDCLQHLEKPDEHMQFHENFRKDIVKRFNQIFSHLEFYELAARPVGMPPTDATIHKLFLKWIDSVAPPKWNINRYPHNPSRDFCAFGL